MDVNYLTLRNLICQNCIFHGRKLYVIFSDCLLEIIIILCLILENVLYNDYYGLDR